MKLITLILFLLSTFSSLAQPPAKELHLPEVGWTLYIPGGSQLLNTAQFDTMKRKAANAINQAYGTTEALNEVVPLFTISDKRYNIFGSTINPYDSSMFATWQESYAASKEMIMDLLSKQGDELKVSDTSSASENIDGLEFQRFYMQTLYPKQNLTMHTYWFYRKQGIYDFSINISYTDEQIGRQYLELVRTSKFNK